MFLSDPPPSEARAALYARDLGDDGYVANVTRLWAWRPDVHDTFVSLRTLVAAKSELSLCERAILVCATAATVGDSYCAFAWGPRLASETDPNTAAEVLQRKDAATLTVRGKALRAWAERVVHMPNQITPADVEQLRKAGFSDEEIFNATVFVAFRLAFSTVNDALGARPDHALAASAPAEIRDAVTYGRTVSEPFAK